MTINQLKIKGRVHRIEELYEGEYEGNPFKVQEFILEVDDDYNRNFICIKLNTKAVDNFAHKLTLGAPVECFVNVWSKERESKAGNMYWENRISCYKVIPLWEDQPSNQPEPQPTNEVEDDDLPF